MSDRAVEGGCLAGLWKVGVWPGCGRWVSDRAVEGGCLTGLWKVGV